MIALLTPRDRLIHAQMDRRDRALVLMLATAFAGVGFAGVGCFVPVGCELFYGLACTGFGAAAGAAVRVARIQARIDQLNFYPAR